MTCEERSLGRTHSRSLSQKGSPACGLSLWDGNGLLHSEALRAQPGRKDVWGHLDPCAQCLEAGVGWGGGGGLTAVLQRTGSIPGSCELRESRAQVSGLAGLGTQGSNLGLA